MLNRNIKKAKNNTNENTQQFYQNTQKNLILINIIIG